MRRRNRFFMLVAGLGAASGLALSSCSDTLGQDEEPSGPLKVTRVTLMDETRPDGPLLTDTSAPEKCDGNSLDVYCAGPAKNTFHPSNHPPTPDSGHEMRVVFNKLPLKLGSGPIETVQYKMDPVTKMPTTEIAGFTIMGKPVTLVCVSNCAQDGSEVPIGYQLAYGSDLSADPDGSIIGLGPIYYGPAIRAAVNQSDAAALEPEATYEFKIDPGLAGRDGATGATAEQRLVRFTTESMKLLQVGIGDPDHDEWVDKEPATTFDVGTIPDEGVIALRANAALTEAVKAGKPVAKIDGTDVAVGLGIYTTDGKTCSAGDQHTVYIYPTAAARNWGGKAGTLTITLQGSDIRDLPQSMGHTGTGKHTLKGTYTLTAKLSGMPADAKYTGMTADAVFDNKDCK